MMPTINWALPALGIAGLSARDIMGYCLITLFFTDKITLNEDWQVVLKSNEDKLLSMFRRGIAAESDMNAVKAERLNLRKRV